MMSSRTVYIVIGCDTDPDREGLLDGVPPGTLTWRGMTEGIPAVKQSLRGVRDSAGHEPAFTWLLRADEQIRQLHGEYGWVVRTHQAFLRSLQASGDELGWHPHFWRRDTSDGPWFQEVADVDWQVEMLRQAHGDLASCFTGAPKSVRMGWIYHNNRTWQALEDLGVAVDFSALPGMRTFTGTPPERGENIFDWDPTPREPYRPSRADYRRKARDSEESSPVLEVPNFVSTSMLWGMVSGLQLARKTRDPALLWQAVRRPTYWINITARHRFFAPLVTQLRRTLRRRDRGPLVFATYFHPDELLPNRSQLYNLESVRTNLEALVRACHEADTAVEFVTAGQIPALWPA
jgi:hypothetical protein